MAVAFDGASPASTTGVFASSMTFSHTVTSNSDGVLAVGASWLNQDETLSSVTYAGSGSGWAKVTGGEAATASGGGGFGMQCELWSKVTTATGANDVVVTMGGTTELMCGAVSFTGVDQTTPFGTVATATGASSTPSVAVSSAVNDMVISIVVVDATQVNQAASNDTQRYEGFFDNFNGTYGSGATAAGAASVTMDWTVTGTPAWAILGVSVKQVSAGGGAGIVSNIRVGT